MRLEVSKPAAYILAVCGYSRSTMIRQANRDIVLWAVACTLLPFSEVLTDVCCCTDCSRVVTDDVADLASLLLEEASRLFNLLFSLRDWSIASHVGIFVSNTMKSIADSVDRPIWNMSVFSSRVYCTTTVWCRESVYVTEWFSFLSTKFFETKLYNH